MRAFFGWKFWMACAILAVAYVLIAASHFPTGFWTPYTTILVIVTFVILAAVIVAIGLVLVIVLYEVIFHSLVPVTKECCTDEVFGELTREIQGKQIGSWDGSVDFKTKPETTIKMMVSIDADDGPPVAEQREFFRQIQERYVSLWPHIAAALADYHEQLKTAEDITKHVGEPSLHIFNFVPGEPLAFEFQYSFDEEDEGEFYDFCGYFVHISEWTINGVSMAD